ncbi:hypothetical protein [Paracidovorax valerianellae]|nr:hypothetical protein [Paracidovorax valerianellae]MDA8443811.1 hypothetical protein [Paracidovorax valerianellae]
MKYIFWALLITPLSPLFVVLIFHFYSPSLMGDAFDRAVNGLTPLLRMFFVALCVIWMPFYLTRTGFKNSFAKWVAFLVGCAILLINPFSNILTIPIEKIHLISRSWFDGLSYYNFNLYLKLFIKGSLLTIAMLFFPMIFSSLSFLVMWKIEKLIFLNKSKLSELKKNGD